jgi:DnaJ-class molecular chaperone
VAQHAQVPISDIVRPGSVLTVPGEGMPLPATPGTKGNLLIEIDLLFPTHLTETQKMLMRRCARLRRPAPAVLAVEAARDCTTSRMPGHDSGASAPAPLARAAASSEHRL